jgi:hypothetical protein
MMNYSSDKIVPPFEHTKFSEMNKKQAKQYFDWYMSVLPDRIRILLDAFERTGGGTKDELDYTPKSLIKLWKWFMPHVELVNNNSEELEKESQETPDWIKDTIIDIDQISTTTLTIAMDIAMYYGEVFVRNYETAEWGIVTTKSVNESRPVILGFKIGRYNKQMDVMRMLHSLTLRVSKGNENINLLYDSYDNWLQQVNGTLKTHMTDELLPIKRSRKKPNVGDVFVIQPRDSVYFYGKVIKTDIDFQGFSVNASTILVYKEATNELKLPDSLNANELLIPPSIVNSRGWTMGYFYTLGNIELTEEEINLDYGFKDSRRETGWYRTEEGELLDQKPLIIGTYGLGSYGAIAYEVTKALEEHPELLNI